VTPSVQRRQALEAGDVERSIRTVALLAFLTSVIEKDNNLTRRMFWSNSSNFILTSALKQLLKRLRKSIESVPPEPCQVGLFNLFEDMLLNRNGLPLRSLRIDNAFCFI